MSPDRADRESGGSPDERPQEGARKPRGRFLAFWSSLPGVLTGVAAVLGAAAAAVAAAAGVLNSGGAVSAASCTNPRSLHARGVIYSVGSHGCTVGGSEIASGRIAAVGRGREARLVVQSGTLYFPQAPVLAAADGSWTSAVEFGGPGTFSLILVMAGPAAQKQFRSYVAHGKHTGVYVGVPANHLASDLTVLSTISGLTRPS